MSDGKISEESDEVGGNVERVNCLPRMAYAHREKGAR